MNAPGPAKLPHHLRLILLLLRVALGLDFFYLGWSSLFNHSLLPELREQSLGQLYRWMASSNGLAGAWFHPVMAWVFIIIGICLILGLLTTLTSVIAIALIVFGYLPIVTYPNIALTQFINDGVIM